MSSRTKTVIIILFIFFVMFLLFPRGCPEQGGAQPTPELAQPHDHN